MARKKHRFQSPPPADPIAAARDSSLVFRLNFGFFLAPAYDFSGDGSSAGGYGYCRGILLRGK